MKPFPHYNDETKNFFEKRVFNGVSSDSRSFFRAVPQSRGSADTERPNSLRLGRSRRNGNP